MSNFIKVTTRDGEVWINSDLIEMIVRRGNQCNLRMNEKLFVEVAESVEQILDMMKPSKDV